MGSKSIVNAYLLMYNGISAIGWAGVLYITLNTVITSYGNGENWENIARNTWNAVHVPLLAIQSLAFMEVVHAAIGLVRSPLMSTLMQVSSRLWLVWVINYACPDSRYQFGFPLMVFSWSLVEVPRYSFYALNIYGKVPNAIFFLRYHLFMVLYPSGVAGEVLCMISALPYLASGAYSIQLPNPHNVAISLYMLVIITLVIYVPGLPVMYSHMITQRNRAYAKLKAE